MILWFCWVFWCLWLFSSLFFITFSSERRGECWFQGSWLDGGSFSHFKGSLGLLSSDAEKTQHFSNTETFLLWIQHSFTMSKQDAVSLEGEHCLLPLKTPKMGRGWNNANFGKDLNLVYVCSSYFRHIKQELVIFQVIVISGLCILVLSLYRVSYLWT